MNDETEPRKIDVTPLTEEKTRADLQAADDRLVHELCDVMLLLHIAREKPHTTITLTTSAAASTVQFPAGMLYSLLRERAEELEQRRILYRDLLERSQKGGDVDASGKAEAIQAQAARESDSHRSNGQ